MSQTTIQKQQGAAIEKKDTAVATVSSRFLADVEKQFSAEMGSGLAFTALERRLTQHVYLSVDQYLKASEADRVKKNKPGAEFNWFNVDRQKLALDTVHRVSLGLDALIPNHIWPVAYFNTAKEKFDVDLRVGYVGRDFVARKHAVEAPIDIVYELVHASDTFKALPRSASREVESYEFEIDSPFDRGSIVGGFGYVVYDDRRKNRLIIITPRDFARSKKASRSNFWADNDIEMHLKTVVHRVASKIPMDPEKVNASAFAAVMSDDDDRDPVTIAHQEVDAARQLANASQEPLTVDVNPVQAAAPESEPVEVPQSAPARASEQPLHFATDPGF